MRRDPEATKARILEAAAAEFAEAGLHGARYDRIAVRAKANKERIYSYFGDKPSLFAAVLSDRLPMLADAHRLEDATRIAEHIGELFDFHTANPDVIRLALWEALHCAVDEDLPGVEDRQPHYERRREALHAVTADDPDVEAGQLSFLLTSLVAAWFAFPSLARMHVNGTGGAVDHDAEYRRFVMVMAERLARGPTEP
jgi:AcrR family transcriptional regulator